MRKIAMSIALAAFVLFAGGEVLAEGRDSVPELSSPAADYPSSVGVFVSSWSGPGLSYQRWHGSLGYALTAGGFASPASNNGTELGYFDWNYNVELDVMYRLFASNFWNWLSGDLFAYATLSHKGESGATFDDDGTYLGREAYSPTVSVGLGIGYEIVVFRHFSFPLMFGYVVDWPFGLDFHFGGGMRYRY